MASRADRPRGAGDSGDGDFDADVAGMGGGIVTPDELARLAELDDQLDAARLEHARQRTVLEAEHPALAPYTSEDALDRVSRDDFGAAQVAWDLDGNLVDIAKTRAALADGLWLA